MTRQQCEKVVHKNTGLTLSQSVSEEGPVASQIAQHFRPWTGPAALRKQRAISIKERAIVESLKEREKSLL